MMRWWVYPLIFLANGAMAQEFVEPDFDPSILESCLADATIEDKTDCLRKASAQCMETENGYTTIGMTYCTGEEYDLWDARLNAAYQEAMTVSKDYDTREQVAGVEMQAPLLKEMQQKWIAFRDAACAFERSQWGGGSGGGPATMSCMLEMTARQAEYLRSFRLPG